MPATQRFLKITSVAALLVATALASAGETPLGSGLDRTGFDTSTRPQDDLFDHVNGGWVASAEMPADKARWGSFIMLSDQAQADVRSLIEEVSQVKDAPTGSPTQKIRDYYNAYMDTAAANEAGLKPLHAMLDEIYAANTHDDIARLLGALARYGIFGPVGGFVFSDARAPDTNVLYLSQSGLTLPDRDYYLSDDERYATGRQLLREYAAAVLKEAGRPDTETIAEQLLQLETRMAQVQWSREQTRDRVAQYNPMNFEQLQQLSPGIDWAGYFDAADIPMRERYIVSQPSYFEAVDDVFTETPVSLWREYVAMKTISAFAPVLSDRLFTLNFDFFKAGLQGIEQPEERWKRAVGSINSTLGELLGQLYVERHFQPEAKQRMDTMIDNLIKAYEVSIKDLEWMSEETKTQALDKLSKFTPKIGYPDQWRDYSSLQVRAGDLVGNVKRAAEFEYLRNLNKLDRPVDKNEWFMTPQTVNAYYNPTWNEIVFPAAILQTPFFNVDAEDAVNYGGIGAVIGHEIGHGFDDQGRRSDGDGNLRDWWTEQDNQRFLERKNKLAAQYNGYEVIDGLTINGEFTSGENIGDLGGLAIAHLAYQMSLQGKDAPVIDGLTGDQRFFMGWAQVWRAKSRPEETKRRLTVDPHSPPKYRANGAAVNVPAFYEAFDIKPGDGMYLPPEQRVKIW